MRTHLSIAAAGLLLLAGAGAATAQTVVVSPEQETVIREYVVKEKVQPVEVPADVQISVGATLPDTVELHTLDAPDIGGKYSYVVVGGQTVLVDPGTRKIVHIVQ